MNHRLRALRGSRLAAITSGGAIPETALFTVVAEPDGVVVGSAFERAIEESAGNGQLYANAEALARKLASGLLSKSK